MVISKGLFDAALRIFNGRNDLDVVGGPNLTPLSNSLFQKSCGYALSSFFGTWKMNRRYHASKKGPADERSLSLCNLAIRKDALTATGLRFNEKVTSNEENLLLQELSFKGRKMLYDPGLVVYHDRRETYPGFIKQIFNYGRGRANNIRLVPATLDPIFFLPSALIIYVLSLMFIHNISYASLSFCLSSSRYFFFVLCGV